MGRVDVNATQYHQGLQLQEDQGSNHPPPPQETIVPPPSPPPAADQYYQPPPPQAAADQPYPPPPPLPSHHATTANNNNPWSSVPPATTPHNQDREESPKSSSSSEEDRPDIFPPPQQFHHEEDVIKPPHEAENMPHVFPPPPPPAQHDYHHYNSADVNEKPQAFPPPQQEFREETPQAFPPPQQPSHQFVHQFPQQQNAAFPHQQQSAFPNQQQNAAFLHQQQSAFPQQQQNGAFVGGIAMGQPHQFIQQQPTSPFVHPQVQIQPWSSSLFDCMNDPQNAIITACFPCVTFGQIAEIVDAGNSSCGTSGMMYACIAFLIAMPCLVSCGYRSKMRSKFGLIESPAPDWMVHCFCEWCALCQEYRELQGRGLDPAIGWVGNVARQMQQQQQVRMTPPMQQRMM